MNLKEYIPIWDKLTIFQQQQLENASAPQHFSKGSLLHNGSADCTGLILVVSGQLRAYTISDEGREITIYRLFERDICLFSASCMLNSLQFDITIEAEKDTDIILISPTVYKQIMEVSAPLANFTNEIMASRLSEVMWLIDQILWKSFDKRLADFLINEANIEGTNTLKTTHETIGNHLGSPREVVTRMLKYFQNEGMVTLSRGTIELTNVEKLEQILD